MHNDALRDLQRIPGVGPRTAGDILRLGHASVDSLRGQDPEALYQALMDLEGRHVDRCVLYVFRCAVYFAQGGRDADKLKWWNWKDEK